MDLFLTKFRFRSKLFYTRSPAHCLKPCAAPLPWPLNLSAQSSSAPGPAPNPLAFSGGFKPRLPSLQSPRASPTLSWCCPTFLSNAAAPPCHGTGGREIGSLPSAVLRSFPWQVGHGSLSVRSGWRRTGEGAIRALIRPPGASLLLPCL